MAERTRCPDCGYENEPNAASCAMCHFPLDREDPIQEPDRSPLAGPAEPPATVRSPGASPPRRPLRRRPPPSNIALSLWLVFGTFAALVVVYIAFRANYDRVNRPVEGSNEAQQATADSLLRLLERDSTNVSARVRIGDILYDTGNWSDAIVQYRSAVRMDSSLATALVDLGVCYYNLGSHDEAERHFRLALARDPHQPVALFNLGIVSERHENYRAALDFFHRALQSGPPDDMREPLMQAMQRVADKVSTKAGPLPDGR